MNIAKDVKKYKKEMITLLKELIATDTSNPPGNEYRAVNVIEKYLNKNNIKYQIAAKDKKRPNLIIRIGEGSTKILTAAHTDVVPAGDGWNTNPLEGVIKKGRMYGRGAIDNKGPLAAIIILAKILKQYEDKLNGQVIIVAVADEEAGNEFGMSYLMDEKIITANYAVIPDISGNCKQIDVAEKGVLFLNVTCYGKQAHGSSPDFGINAIDHMMQFNDKIKKSKFLKVKHKLLGKPTINLGLINGGIKHNIVPGKCVAGFDIRYVSGITKDDILTELKKIADSIGDFKFKIIIHHIPTEVNPDNELVKTIQKNILKVTGNKGEIIGLEGATVCKDLIKNGIFAIGFSAGDNELVHCANESIDLEELIDFTTILGNSFIEILTKHF